MERDMSLPLPASSTSETTIANGSESDKARLIEWEDYEQEVARLWSLTSALKEVRDKKFDLELKLLSLIEVKEKSLNQLNEIEEMQEKVTSKADFIRKVQVQTKAATDESRKEEQRLSAGVRSLLVAGTTLSVASKALQESNRLLNGDKGYAHLRRIHKTLRMRQQYMVSQVSLIYPVKMVAEQLEEQELESFPSTSRSGYYMGSRPVNQESLTILGLHLSLLPFTKMSFFTDKKEIQKSATALGYVAHAVSLVGSYLKVPLRYPVRLGGCRSYVTDYAPSIDTTSPDVPTTSDKYPKTIEFPLFLDGQDATRAAYAVFLLNKDLEQLLNFIGVKSLGPRNVLANLKELIRTIQSVEFLQT